MRTLRLRLWNIELIGLAEASDPEATDVVLPDETADSLLMIHAQACDLQNLVQTHFEQLMNQKPN